MVLGITGYSGSGKHTAANCLQKKGWIVLDADTIAHYLYRPYTNVWKGIVEEFGERILNQDDSINRSQLGKMVFDGAHPEESEKALLKLNSIVHPYVRRRIEEEIHYHSKKGLSIAVVAALWKELEMGRLCEKVLLVKADPALAKERIVKRDGVSAEAYAMRVKSQGSPERADWVLENNGSPEELYGKIEAVLGV
jgi:dephospho-CoA kinase